MKGYWYCVKEPPIQCSHCKDKKLVLIAFHIFQGEKRSKFSVESTQCSPTSVTREFS